MRQKGLDFGDASPPRPSRPRALTVTELTERIQGVLETEFLDVWVEGEVSNLKMAPSGHWYFSLKDEGAQLRAVVWRTDARLVKFKPRDGMKVLARGTLRVYPPRGEYQLSAQVLEPLGKGSLQQAFEDLKAKLEKEGLFDAARKRPLPMLPRRIGVVSSPTGAVIRDILRVLRSRYANLEALLYPARVQGEGASAEIEQGIRALNRIGGLDVILLARGGGSLEDLWAFNEEGVARAIAASKIPTISAVGHETDFTIADFVADFRAATPSAAAERVVPAKEDAAGPRRRARRPARRRAAAAARPRSRPRAGGHGSPCLRRRAGPAARQRPAGRRAGPGRGHGAPSPCRARRRPRAPAARPALRLPPRPPAREPPRGAGPARGSAGRGRPGGRPAPAGVARALAASLDGLSPLAVLGRGYALVWDEEQGALLRDAAGTEPGRRLRIRLHRGSLRATVLSKETE